MVKKGGSLFWLNVSLSEIFLIITMTFAIAFLLGQSIPSVNAYQLGENVNGWMYTGRTDSQGRTIWSKNGADSYISQGQIPDPNGFPSNPPTNNVPPASGTNNLGSSLIGPGLGLLTSAAPKGGANPPPPSNVPNPTGTPGVSPEMQAFQSVSKLDKNAFSVSFDGPGAVTSTKDVFVNGNLYTDAKVANVQGVDVAQIGTGENTQYAAWNGNSWALTSGSSAPETFSVMGNLNLGTLYGFAPLLNGLVWGGIAYGAIKLIGNMFGLKKGLTDALANGAFAGIMTWKAIDTFIGPKGTALLGQGTEGFGKFLYSNSALIGIGVGILVFLLTYKSTKTQTVLYQCMPYQPPLGGASCEQCNKDPLRPCSEYRCKSLGQACELLNKGTANELCTWVGRGDVTSPTISPLVDALKPKSPQLKYTPNNAIRPPNRGVKIVRADNGGCLPAYTPLEFGIGLNEPGQCKLDFNKDTNFSDMQYYFGGSDLFAYNHTEKLRLPAPDNSNESADTAPLFRNDGTMDMFVRCQDANGNFNRDAFVFTFCVDKSPDTTPPVIEGTSIENGQPVQYNADSVPIQLYANEPVTCKWSRDDKTYDNMENSLICDNSGSTVNADLQFICDGNLTGIKNSADNIFYFRCKDQPDKPEGDRLVNVQSYKLTLKGSQPMNVIGTAPNGTIKGGTTTVPVELYVKTDDGAEQGKANCYFSPTGENLDSFVLMANTNGFESRQTLDLTNGDYTYFFRCIDSGGNTAYGNTTFSVLVDKDPPVVTRVYKDNDGLRISTSEDAECVYSTQDCNYAFNDGTPMIYNPANIKDNHFAEWKPKQSYYIKCRDFQGNEPNPNECSVTVRAIGLGSTQTTTSS